MGTPLNAGSGTPWRYRPDRWRTVLFGAVFIWSLLTTALLSWFVLDFLLEGFGSWLRRVHPWLSGIFSILLVGLSWWIAGTFWDGLEPQLDRRKERKEARRALSLEQVLYPRLDGPKLKPKMPDRPN
jgi:hypothetical protein